MIITVDFTNRKNSPTFTKSVDEAKRYCRHQNVYVDDHNRRLTCQSCNKVIDPYDYVSSLADKENLLFKKISWLQSEEATLTASIVKLKNELRNLKTRPRVATKKPILEEQNPVAPTKDKAGYLKEIKDKLK